MKKAPPQIALRFLRWFCKSEYLEEIEGDLVEVFEKEHEHFPQKARFRFRWSIIRYFRPAFIKQIKHTQHFNTPAMIKSDLKISWRSLKKQSFFTFLNTFGLAIGIAGCLLISLYIYDELTFDTMFEDGDRIHRVHADIKFGGQEQKSAETAAPMAEALINDFPQVELVTRFRNFGPSLIRKNDEEANVRERAVTYVDSTFFEMFGVELLYGNPQTALNTPNTVVLTKTAALKHFELSDAIGQNVIIDNSIEFTVTGIIDDLPRNSFLRNHSVFMAMVGDPVAAEENWGGGNCFTFLKLIEGADIDDFQEPLQSLFGTYVIPFAQTVFPGITEEQFLASGNYLNYFTIPLHDIRLYSDRDTELSVNNNIQNIYILSFIALFLIVLAIVNFMNLSTARSLKRAKEVGVRKTLGSNKIELVRQFLIESGLVTFISLIVAMIIAFVVLPHFNELAGKEISIPVYEPYLWLILAIATICLGLLAGSYPAFVMSRFIPVKVLKGSGNTHVGGGRIRNALVVFQFSIAVFLTIGTIVIFQQLQFIQAKDIGFSRSQVLIIGDAFAAGNQIDILKEDLEKLPQVEGVTMTGFLPVPSFRGNTTYIREGGVGQESSLNMQRWFVDHDYIPTLDMEIIAGRNFNEQMASDSTGIILNETAVRILGVEPEEALGLKLSDNLDVQNPEFFTIIGVVRNFHYESLREEVGALSLQLDRSTGMLAVKLQTAGLANTVDTIEGLWNKVVPTAEFRYVFMDDSFDATYRQEQQLSRIFIVFTVLSIFIACLGLFGLTALNAERKIKEIGIRKVLGATVGQITMQLGVDFLKLVGISILIAIPLGWYVMNEWLKDFSYKIDIGADVLIGAAILAIGISILTISYQSIKAANMSPVKSLKSE